MAQGEKMRITMNLSEILERCNNWQEFCDEYGWSEWVVNEGGGDIEWVFSEEDAIRFGVIKGEQ